MTRTLSQEYGEELTCLNTQHTVVKTSTVETMPLLTVLSTASLVRHSWVLILVTLSYLVMWGGDAVMDQLLANHFNHPPSDTPVYITHFCFNLKSIHRVLNPAWGNIIYQRALEKSVTGKVCSSRLKSTTNYCIIQSYLEWNRIKKTRMSVLGVCLFAGRQRLVLHGDKLQIKLEVHSLAEQIFIKYLSCSWHYVGTGYASRNDRESGDTKIKDSGMVLKTWEEL